MADTSVLEADAARREGSSPFPGTIARGERERAIIIRGDGSTMFPYWGGTDLSPELKAKIPAHLTNLDMDKAHWTRGPRHRQLNDPVDAGRCTLADGRRGKVIFAMAS